MRGGDTNGKKKKSKRPVIELPPAEGHTDAVMPRGTRQPNCSRAARPTRRHGDVSGDLSSSARHHTDKVQALAPGRRGVLLSAGFDRKVFALDVRSPDAVRHWPTLTLTLT